jgi:hypothetical protein
VLPKRMTRVPRVTPRAARAAAAWLACAKCSVAVTAGSSEKKANDLPPSSEALFVSADASVRSFVRAIVLSTHAMRRRLISARFVRRRSSRKRAPCCQGLPPKIGAHSPRSLLQLSVKCVKHATRNASTQPTCTCSVALLHRHALGTWKLVPLAALAGDRKRQCCNFLHRGGLFPVSGIANRTRCRRSRTGSRSVECCDRFLPHAPGRLDCSPGPRGHPIRPLQIPWSRGAVCAPPRPANANWTQFRKCANSFGTPAWRRTSGHFLGHNEAFQCTKGTLAEMVARASLLYI